MWAITNVSVLTPAATLYDRVVLVDGGRIEAVQTEGESPLPPDVTLIDGRGGLLVPGFIDLQLNGAGASTSPSARTVSGPRPPGCPRLGSPPSCPPNSAPHPGRLRPRWTSGWPARRLLLPGRLPWACIWRGHTSTRPTAAPTRPTA
jgi:hypothetical protein